MSKDSIIEVALDIEVYSSYGQMQILSIYMDRDKLIIDVEQDDE